MKRAETNEVLKTDNQNEEFEDDECDRAQDSTPERRNGYFCPEDLR